MASTTTLPPNPPRGIRGCVGSRIRVILGETGNDYLLLLNHDDGDSEWQDKKWRGIPNALARQINNCTNKGRYVKEVDYFTQQDGPACWYVNGVKRDGTGNHSWWGGTNFGHEIKKKVNNADHNIVCFGSSFDGYSEDESCVIITGRNGFFYKNVDSNELTRRIKRINKANKAIQFVRLFDFNRYFIKDDEGTQWQFEGSPLSKELKKHQASDTFDLAVARDGSWIIVGRHSFQCSSGVSSELTKALQNFYNIQKAHNSKRANEIRIYHEQKREAEMVEAIERAVHEELQRQREEEERQLREARQQEVREERELVNEAGAIQLLEEQIEDRKRALQDSVASLPPARRARVEACQSTRASLVRASSSRTNHCVICHEHEAKLAIVPCGHVCLCSQCEPRVMEQQPPPQYYDYGADATQMPRCPICRGVAQQTLKIFLQE